MFFCRKCLIAAAVAPKVLTPILVPAATATEEEEEEEEEGEEKEDSTPKMINASRNTPRTSPTIPPINPITKPNKTRMITLTKSILIVWRSSSPIKVARLLIMSRGAQVEILLVEVFYLSSVPSLTMHFILSSHRIGNA